jgi:hypothetical protein
MSGIEQVQQAMNKPEPQIEMTHSQVLCMRHGEVFKTDWPTGFAKFAMNGLQVVMSYRETVEETQGDVHAINNALLRRPICCRLHSDDFLALLQGFADEIQPKFGYRASCEGCKGYIVGTKITHYTKHGKKVKAYDRLCFKCFINLYAEHKLS